MSAVEALKEQLAEHLCRPEEVQRPEGLATGLAALDHYLFWNGIPKGALSLFTGTLGTGATSLWLEAATRAVQAGKWVVWINQDGAQLSPLPLKQKGINLGHFVSIDFRTAGDLKTETATHEKASQEKLFWLLQELMSSSLFELVGCDLGELQLKDHQLRKLQAQARDAGVALVFFSQRGDSRSKPFRPRGSTASIFSLIVSFQKKKILVERALHRNTPHSLPRSVSYARFVLPQNLGSSDNGNQNTLLETQPTSLFGS